MKKFSAGFWKAKGDRVMIEHSTGTNFLRHVFSRSIKDIANITVAQAEDDYDTIIQYLFHLRLNIKDWIEELETEKENKK